MDDCAEIRPGDRVIVRGGFGHDLPVEVEVKSVGMEAVAKVFDYFDPHRRRDRWAYLDQIVGKVTDAPTASDNPCSQVALRVPN